MTKRLPLDNPKRHMTELERRCSIAMYLELKWTIDEIAHYFNRNRDTIYQLMKRTKSLRKDQIDAKS